MIRVELAKQLGRLRTLVVLGLCVLVPALVAVGVGVAKPHPEPGRRGAAAGVLAAPAASGIAAGILAVSFAATFLLPVAVAVLTGEPLAGEARWGSLRYLLVRPVSRNRLLAVKLGVGVVLGIVASFLVPITATLVGTAFLGWHGVPVVAGHVAVSPLGITLPVVKVLAPGTALARLALTTCYFIWSMGAVVGVATLVGVLSENVLAAVAAGFGIEVVSAILDAVPGLEGIRPGLPTNYLSAWTALFTPGSSTAGMVHGLVVQVPWLAVTLGLAFYRFARKDVLS